MRSLLRSSIVLTLLLILLMPAMVLAYGGPFYTTSDPNADPDGAGISYATIRGVDTDMGLLQEACEYFYNEQGGTAGSWVYWHNVADQQWFRYRLKSDASCSPAGEPTAPPENGVLVTPPLIISGLFACGLLLTGAAWGLSRRGRQAT